MGVSGVNGGSKRWRRNRAAATAVDQWEEMDQRVKKSSAAAVQKRVMVVVDGSGRAKHAMVWALTHVAVKGDIITLLHVPPPPPTPMRDEEALMLARSLAALCKACKPEVEVEALVIRGLKLETVLSQVKKLEVSVLVLSQPKPSLLCCCRLLRRRTANEEVFVEECIEQAKCLTFAVRKQSPSIGGYLISTKWQKNFWLLA